MTQSLLLVEGKLALPTPPKTGGLPPPFGRSWQADGRASEGAWMARPARPPEPPPRPAHASRRAAPTAPKHILFYKAPVQRRVDTRSIDAALEEAKRYLAIGPARPSSTRSDYMLGAAIVAGCSIVLAWLLVSCTVRQADKEKEIPERPVISTTAAPIASAPLLPAPTPKVAVAAAPDYSAAKQLTRPRAMKPQRIAEAHAAQRIATSHVMRAKARPLASVQPEWPAKSVRNNDAAEQAALMNWAVQQRHRAQMVRVATSPDENWSTRMTQQRITDNPDAFQTGRAKK